MHEDSKSCRFTAVTIIGYTIDVKQEAQLPQRNSASAVHMDGGGGFGPPAHSSTPPLVIPVRMVESESHNVRTSSVPSVKRTFIGHSRSFKVIVIGAGRNPERCIVVMYN